MVRFHVGGTVLPRVLRWFGRITSLVVLAFIVLSATTPSAAPSATQAIGLVFFPGMVGVGLLLAWWRERTGVLLATVGLVGFYAWSFASGAHFARGPWFAVCWSPAVFFAGSWYLRHRQAARVAAST
jgi:hypothetical protein